MRTITLVILQLIITVLSFNCNSLFAQSKGDNTIIIRERLKPSQIVNVLFDNGYMIEKSDSSFISTGIKLIKSYHFKLTVNIRDSSVLLKGFDQMTFMGSTDLLTVSNRGMKNSLEKLLWNEMDRIGKILSKRIEYLRQ